MKKHFFKKINKACPAKRERSGGYTIIEAMVAISLFIIVVTIGLGSLLNANLLHKKSQNNRSILDNLSFVMEDMSRNLRIGYDYHCIDDGILTTTIPHSCVVGGGVSFQSSLGGQWVYYIATNPSDSTTNSVFKIVNGTTVQLTPDEIKIDSASSFIVEGAEPPPNAKQPFVTIKLVGSITSEGISSPFSLQTSVSQRKLDW